MNSTFKIIDVTMFNGICVHILWQSNLLINLPCIWNNEEPRNINMILKH